MDVRGPPGDFQKTFEIRLSYEQAGRARRQPTPPPRRPEMAAAPAADDDDVWMRVCEWIVEIKDLHLRCEGLLKNDRRFVPPSASAALFELLRGASERLPEFLPGPKSVKALAGITRILWRPSMLAWTSGYHAAALESCGATLMNLRTYGAFMRFWFNRIRHRRMVISAQERLLLESHRMELRTLYSSLQDESIEDVSVEDVILEGQTSPSAQWRSPTWQVQSAPSRRRNLPTSRLKYRSI